VRILGNGTLPPEPLFQVMRGAFRDFKLVQPFPKRLRDDELRSIATPVLLLFGEHTPMCDPQQAVDRARRLIPQVHAEVVPGSAHAPPIDNPPLLNRRILEFIDGIDNIDGIAQD
jgi:pimeloyl-ACP methyl ester carboxylesterase